MLDVQGRGGPFCDLKVGVLPDNYVVLESVSQPGNYVNMTARGIPSPSNTVLPTSPDAQFFVRLSKQFYASRAPLTTPTGMPSLFAKLRNDMIIQLEAFHTGVFLSAMPNTVVGASSNPMDPNSKLIILVQLTIPEHETRTIKHCQYRIKCSVAPRFCSRNFFVILLHGHYKNYFYEKFSFVTFSLLYSH